MYTAYILFSEKHNKSYAGYTSDMARRLMDHNETGEKGYTKAYRPWTLIYTEEYEDKTTAIIRERYYKTGVGREKIKELIDNYKKEKGEKC